MSPSERARLANEILNNEVFIDAFRELENDLTVRWKCAGTGEFETREACWFQIEALQNVWRKLENYIATGQFERKP